MRARRTCLVLAALSLAGCKSYVRPFDDRPLPAREVVTRGGQILEAKDGQLFSKVGPTEIGRALGVELAEDEKGVVVASVRRDLSPLRAGDRIVHVSVVSSSEEYHEVFDARERAEAAAFAKQPPVVLGARLSEGDVTAVARLWRIYSAEDIFRNADLGRKGLVVYATLDELARAGLVDGATNRDGYTYHVDTPNGAEQEWCWAAEAYKSKSVDETGGSDLYFFVNQGGVVYAGRGALPRVDEETCEVPSGLVAIGPPPKLDTTALQLDLPTPAAVRARKDGHAVRSIADLQVYMVALGWAHLDLVIEHAGAERVARVQLEESKESVPVVSLHAAFDEDHPENTVAGVELASVEDLPEALRPAYAHLGAQLVLRVAQGSAAAVAGLRPLDAFPRGLLESYRNYYQSRPLALCQIWSAAGYRDIPLRDLAQGATYEYWIPFVFAVESDPIHTHVGLGPLDALLHYSSKKEYNADQDAYVTTRRFSLATTLCRTSYDGPSGTKVEDEIDVIDTARLDYFNDWSTAK